MKTEIVRKNLNKFEKYFKDNSWVADENRAGWTSAANSHLGKKLTSYLIKSKLAKFVKEEEKDDKILFKHSLTSNIRKELAKKYQKEKIDKEKFLELAMDKLEPTEGIYGPDIIKYIVWKKKIAKNPKLKKYMHNKMIEQLDPGDYNFYRKASREF